MKSFRSGRGGSSLRGKSNPAKVSAPLPVNLPSRRHEKAGYGYDTLVSSTGSSWGSPQLSSPALLSNGVTAAGTGGNGATSSAASSPATEGGNSYSPLGSSGPGGGSGSFSGGDQGHGLVQGQGQGGDSPLLDSSAAGGNGSPYQKNAPRAWGVVALTPEQSRDEYPTAAEAAKKTQEMHEQQQNHAHTNNSNIGSTSSGKRTMAPSNTNSGEPMAKTVSALSSSADNWDEADEDENVDFLNAEAIEFADGSVIVAAAVAQTAESQKTGEPFNPKQTPTSKQTSLTGRREERVVERGEVDFNRAWPNRPQSLASGPTSHQSHTEPLSRHGTQDRSHQPLWQGASSDRRLSVDRTPSHQQHLSQNPNLSQRRESFSRDPYQQGGPRRESAGQKEHAGFKEQYQGPRRDSSSFRGEPLPYERRDSYPHERRESFNRSGSFNRDREPQHHREGEYNNQDRRPSHDRPPYTSDRFPDRHQRDFQLLTRPKEASNDRLGPHDTALGGHGAPHPQQQPYPNQQQYPNYPLPGARGPQEPIHSRDSELHSPNHSHAHVAPPGMVDYDRPPQVTEDQKDAMKHAAEEARKRREEDEKKIEESKARARARADEMAKKAEEAKLAKEKEEEAAKEKERLAKEEAAAAAAEETRKMREKAEAEVAALAAAAAIAAAIASTRAAEKHETVREFGHPRDRSHVKNNMNETDKQEAMAQWQALPERLVKEETDRAARVREEWRSKHDEEQRKTTTTPASNAAPWKRSGHTTTGNGASGTFAKSDSSSKVDDRSTSSISHGSSHSGNFHPAPQEPPMEHLDKVMHRIEERLHGRGNAAQVGQITKQKPLNGLEATATITSPTKATEEVDSALRPVAREKTRNAKASRAEKDQSESASPSWRKDESKLAANSGSIKREHTKECILDNAKSLARTNGRISRSAAAAIGKGNYPAKLNGLNGTVKISQVSDIHARLSLQRAGDFDIELPGDRQQEDKGLHAPHAMTSGKSDTETSAQKHLSGKRNSLLDSTTAIIFPSNVEKAAKNRGSMSFMVDSEIDGTSPDLNDEHEVSVYNSTQPIIMTTSQWGDSKAALPNLSSLPNKEIPANDSIKKAWDSTLSPDQQQLDSIHVSQQYQHSGQGGSAVSQGMPMGPGMYMMGGSGTGGVNPMAQHMWNASLTGAESSSQAGGGTSAAPGSVVMSGPGGSAPGHPGQSFPMMMPYYHQGFPVNGPTVYYMYPPRGPMPPPLAQFPAGVMPPHGSMAASPRDGATLVSPDMVGPIMSASHSSANTADTKTDGGAGGNGNNAAVLGPHHWLPRFSAAGDAPPQQAVAGGSFLVPVPASQHANMMAAANINRVPQPRPFGHHHAPQQPQPLGQQQPQQQQTQQHTRMHGAGPASLESSFQDGPGSPSSTDGWSSNATIASGSTAMTSPSNSGGNVGGARNQTQGAGGSSGSSSSWNGGNGRMNGGPGGVGPGSYGGYQQQQQPVSSSGLAGSSQTQQHHPHANASHRGGGRGGFNGGYNYREFRPRGGYSGGHMGQHHQSHHHHQQQQGSGYHFGQQQQQQQQVNQAATGPHQQQQPSGLGVDHQSHSGHHVNQHSQQMNNPSQVHGRTVSNVSNEGNNSGSSPFGAAGSGTPSSFGNTHSHAHSHSHRSPHASATVTTTSSALQY